MPFCHQCGYNLRLGIEKFCPSCGFNLNGYDKKNSRYIGIIDNNRDIIGVGIDGNGNIIWKNVSIIVNEFFDDCGLTLLPPNHFKDNTDTEENVQQWREKGYQLSLESIYKKERV